MEVKENEDYISEMAIDKARRIIVATRYICLSACLFVCLFHFVCLDDFPIMGTQGDINTKLAISQSLSYKHCLNIFDYEFHKAINCDSKLDDNTCSYCKITQIGNWLILYSTLNIVWFAGKQNA